MTTGGTTVAVTDLRKGIIRRSENQDDELVSSAYVTGLKASGSSQGEKLVVGGGSGVLTLWEKGAWDDLDERIVVDRSASGAESLDALTVIPDELGKGNVVVAGQADGRIQFVEVGKNKVVSEARHDDLEGVIGLGFDVDGRMVSSGGSIVKVWDEAGAASQGEEDEEQDESLAKKKRPTNSDVSSDDDEDDSDNNKTKGNGKRKKRKRTKGKDQSGGQHVMAFAGLD